MNLLIDDIKNLAGWDVIARNAAVGKMILQAFSASITHLGIDHDLGGRCSGYDILKWALDNNCLPPVVEIVSMNPVGAKNMKMFLLHDANYLEKGRAFIRGE